MNPIFSAMKPMMQIMSQYQQIRNNPSQLGQLLMEKGFINEQQAQDIVKMGGDYGKVGEYLMSNKIMPQPTQQVLSQAQSVMQQNSPA